MACLTELFPSISYSALRGLGLPPRGFSPPMDSRSAIDRQVQTCLAIARRRHICRHSSSPLCLITKPSDCEKRCTSLIGSSSPRGLRKSQIVHERQIQSKQLQISTKRRQSHVILVFYHKEFDPMDDAAQCLKQLRIKSGSVKRLAQVITLSSCLQAADQCSSTCSRTYSQ